VWVLVLTFAMGVQSGTILIIQVLYAAMIHDGNLIPLHVPQPGPNTCLYEREDAVVRFSKQIVHATPVNSSQEAADKLSCNFAMRQRKFSDCSAIVVIVPFCIQKVANVPRQRQGWTFVCFVLHGDPHDWGPLVRYATRQIQRVFGVLTGAKIIDLINLMAGTRLCDAVRMLPVARRLFANCNPE
jgi:hypothetical protein